MIDDIDPPLVRAVLEMLAASGASYQVLRHEPVFTSEQASAVRGTPLDSGAKALLHTADSRPILIVVPAHIRLDSRRFKQAYGVKNLRMVSTEEVETLGAVVGGVPPFGHLMGVQTYADEGIMRPHLLSFNAGNRTTSVILQAEDYGCLEQPIIGAFTTG